MAQYHSLGYVDEREGFLRDLRHFHDARGTPFRHLPKLNGREVDLHMLYTLVSEQGGWIKVNSKNSWSDFFEPLEVPDNCVNASIALKQIYLRYLARWEKVHLGDEGDRASDDDDENRHKRGTTRNLHAVPSIYNYQQHNVSESAREYNNLSTDLHKPSDYDRLGLSLLSPLPNEQDFAINVCTLLSNDGKHTLKLEKHPVLLDYLLAHAGVFNHGSLRKVLSYSYGSIRKQNIDGFWKEALESEEFLDLTNENLFLNDKKNSDVVPIVDLAKRLEEEIGQPIPVVKNDSEDLFASVDCVIDNVPKGSGGPVKLNTDQTDKDLFNLGRNLGTREYMGQRVLQVATILRNLSFFEENVTVLARNRTYVRFTLLCACSRWNQLMNLGLEMLGNLSAEFQMTDYDRNKVSQSLIRIVSQGLLTDDRNWCITALEVLNKLSQNEANEEVMLRCLEAKVYERVCSFLTIHDVMLLIYTLECLYSLSSLGERACNCIVNIYGAVDTLVSLVTVEGKSYGPKACIGMKLVETVTGSAPAQQPANSSTTSVATPSATTVTVSSSNIASPSAPAAVLVHSVQSPASTKAIAPSTPVRQVAIAPQRLITSSPAPAATATSTTTTSVAHPITPQQLQQKHAHQQTIQENEQFALTWLRATYELCTNGKVEHQELYKHYINSCAKIGRRGVIAPHHFPRCVRSVFGGTVGPNPEKPATPNAPQYYDGIKVRAQPLVINVHSTTTQVTPVITSAKGVTVRRKLPSTNPITTPGGDAPADQPPASPASPILKAQLSAPPKPREAAPASTKADGAKSQVMAHPHLSQALLGSGCATTTSTGLNKEQGQSNTSLIKSLLATKVNECMTPVSMRTDCQTVVQVAARQQQQRLLAQQNQQQQVQQVIVEAKTLKTLDAAKSVRLNGARQLFLDNDVADSVVSSTTQSLNAKTRREPPQPPPPLAPLSNNRNSKVKIDNEDSDSTGNNSLASSTGIGIIGIGGVSSTEDGENSVNSFDGLINGVPSVENPLCMNEDDSNSKDSLKNSSNVIKKPLMLADLLEKKVDKDPPILNGVMGKELRIGEKGLEIVDNHIDKVLNKDSTVVVDAKVNNVDGRMEEGEKTAVKRPASDNVVELETKKPHLSNNLNGSASVDSPAADSIASSNGDEPATASNAAAKLFADLAADILEDEEDETMQIERTETPPDVPQQVQPQIVQTPPPTTVVQQSTPMRQVFVDGNQQVIMTQPRQIIVSQAPTGQVMIPQLKTQSAPTVIVQNTAQQRTPVVQSSMGPILLSQGLQGLQGQMQLVPSGQPGQFVLQAAGTQGFVVAQHSNSQGQPQAVLLAQAPQQQGAKTIIILQPNSNAATHHQKVVVTPQGQQMVVTQVPRPIIQQSSVSNMVTTTGVVKTATATMMATQQNTSNGVTVSQPQEKKEIDVTPKLVVTTVVAPTVTTYASTATATATVVTKSKLTRDVNALFVCEWGDCQIDTKFKSANQVYMHVCKMHIPDTNDELLCQWDRCDNMKRKRFSLMTHINDKHCNTESMKAAQIKRKHIQQTGKTDPPAPPQTTQHPGYAPDAAFHAIKRHALEFVNPKELQRSAVKQGTPSVPSPMPRSGASSSDQDDNEGPVTKSIRLTASLILRNLVIYSNTCRRYLKPYEPHLANVALSNVESSRTIAQVLYDMNDGSNHR